MRLSRLSCLLSLLLLGACAAEDLRPDGLEVGGSWADFQSDAALQGLFFPTLETDGDAWSVHATLLWHFGPQQPMHPDDHQLWRGLQDRLERAIRDQPAPAAGDSEEPGGLDPELIRELDDSPVLLTMLLIAIALLLPVLVILARKWVKEKEAKSATSNP